MPDDSVDAALRTQCEAAAHRASRIQMWLEPVLRDSKAAELAYAFKGRTKSSHDIMHKVLGRRNHENASERSPNYGPPNITDASGFRIVRLFNSEVPDALDQLLSLLTTTLPPGKLNGRLKGGSARTGIREIEFHTSRRPDDPLSIYARVRDVVQVKHGLALKPPVEGKASSYSSVHVLLDCEVDDIAGCSEIQLRSVFEEAWSEISHRLKYAPAKLARAVGTTAGTEPTADVWLHLDALKSLTDGCAQYADLINRQIEHLTAGPAERAPLPLDPAEKSAAMFSRFGPELFGTVKKAYHLRTIAADTTDPEQRGQAFRAAADAFRDAINTFQERGDEDDERLSNQLNEEMAFCYMFSKNAELVNQAEKIYRGLLVAMPNRVSILIRLGQLRRDAGDFAEAKSFMDTALEALNQSPDPDPEVQQQASWLVRHQLGLICWRLVDLDPGREDAATLLHRAIDVTEAAQKFAKTDYQDVTTRQNILYYLVDLWRRVPATERTTLEEKGRGLLKGLRRKLDLNQWSLERLDTMVRGEVIFGQRSRAKPVAREVGARLTRRIAEIMQERNCTHAAAFESLSRDERDMYLNAQEALADA